MRSRIAALFLVPLIAVAASIASADWVAKDASGSNITFDAFTNGTKILSKTVSVDTAGLEKGTVANPVRTQLTGTSTMAATQSGTWTAQAVQSGPWAVGLNAGSNVIGGVTQSGGNWGVNLAQLNGAAVSTSNAVPTTCVSGCSSAEGTLATYSVGDDFVLGTSPTDVATITGSASKTIKIRSIWFTAISTTGLNMRIALIRRSAANTGGTSTTPIIGRMDTTDAAATAVVRLYTANPSALGTAVATIKDIGLPAGTAASLNPSQKFEFGALNSKPIVLRGASDILAINTSGTGGASTFVLSIEWTEE